MSNVLFVQGQEIGEQERIGQFDSKKDTPPLLGMRTNSTKPVFTQTFFHNRTDSLTVFQL